MQELQVQSLGQEDPLEEGTATHSSILAWRIPWTEEPSGLLSIGSQSQTQLKRLSMDRKKRAPGGMEISFRDCKPLAVGVACKILT